MSRVDNDEANELRLAALGGDANAMDALLRMLQPFVMARCARFLPCRSDAEEAAQDALVAVATKLSSFNGQGSFVGWVTVVASNSARSTYRSLKRRGSEYATEQLPEALDPRTTSVIAGSRIDLMEALDAMEAKSPHLVEPFVLRDLGALLYEEIALRLDVPLGTVKSRIHDARAFMRERLIEKLV